MHRYCCIVVGRWKLQDWHLFRLRPHHAAKQPSIRWLGWDRVL